MIDVINQNQYETQKKTKFTHIDETVALRNEPLGDRLFWAIVIGIVSLGVYGITALLL
ncbi:MAG: hypothetical protein QW812_05510 [Thermoplasmataceae archaeon]